MVQDLASMGASLPLEEPTQLTGYAGNLLDGSLCHVMC